MAFNIPKFNCWLRVMRQGESGGTEVGYVKGQIRALRPTMIAAIYNSGTLSYDLPYIEVLLPKGSDVRSYAWRRWNTVPPEVTGGDFIFPLGKTNYGYVVKGVFDVGPGFPNEFRVALCVQTDVFLPYLPVGDHPMYRINTALEPPEGFTPLPILGVADPT